jgi:prevent-host-death family protein
LAGTGDDATSLRNAIGIRALAANVSAVVSKVANTGLPAVVTKHGAPVAALIPIADLDDLLRVREARGGETPTGSDRDQPPDEGAGRGPAE